MRGSAARKTDLPAPHRFTQRRLSRPRRASSRAQSHASARERAGPLEELDQRRDQEPRELRCRVRALLALRLRTGAS